MPTRVGTDQQYHGHGREERQPDERHELEPQEREHHAQREQRGLVVPRADEQPPVGPDRAGTNDDDADGDDDAGDTGDPRC